MPVEEAVARLTARAADRLGARRPRPDRARQARRPRPPRPAALRRRGAPTTTRCSTAGRRARRLGGRPGRLEGRSGDGRQARRRRPRPAPDGLSDPGAVEHFDVVVVGSGSSGGVVAARLSEDEGRRVLLLEAGPDFPDEEELTPLFVVSGGQRWLPAGIPELDWGYWNETLPNGHRVRLARGKLVGGSSMVNGCVAVRGAPFDFDRWAAFGNPGWSWEDVLPYFVELENDLDFGSDPLHGDCRADRHPPLRRAPLGSRPPRVRGGVRRPRPGVRGGPQRAARLGRERRPVAAEPAARGTSRHARHLRAGRAAPAGLRAAGGAATSTACCSTACERPESATSIPMGARSTSPPTSSSSPPASTRRRRSCSARASGRSRTCAAAGIEPVHDLPVGRNLLDHPNCALGFHAPALAERRRPALPHELPRADRHGRRARVAGDSRSRSTRSTAPPRSSSA